MISGKDSDKMYKEIVKYVAEHAENRHEIMAFMMFSTYRLAHSLNFSIKEITDLEEACEQAIYKIADDYHQQSFMA